ncbi:MAG: putative DNA binding domain-containing protein [Gammaproteobacteria bacterium]|nr:putative DNA binding domain-containing protein [Gammaproteobacteria bacterium]
MIQNYSNEHLADLIQRLCGLPGETEWVEFKVNYRKPEDIGKYISAMSNVAALNRKASAYVVWGVEDETHAIVGTKFSPGTQKKGNEPLETWLLRLLEPHVDFRFHEAMVDSRKVILLEVESTTRQPVSFSGEEFVRIGSNTKKLRDHPERERQLWRLFEKTPFEDGVALEHQDGGNVLRLLACPAYFSLLEQPQPGSNDGVLSVLEADELIQRCDAGKWNITNLGAVLFARELGDFGRLKRKAVRIIQYRGADRIHEGKEKTGAMGYACAFENMVQYIRRLIPDNEVISEALRERVPMFPLLAIRELVANALIHQDFSVTGAGPMVEIFDNRIEITNPGEPLVDTQRFVDAPPKSRNEKIASLMRRCRICEERGGGIDKVVAQVEMGQLPAPLFESSLDSTRTVLFSHKDMKDMDKADRVRACYLHACLKYVGREYLTNASLRERFGIEQRSRAVVSRYIREAVNDGKIKPYTLDYGRKYMKYQPFWA